MLFDRDPRMPFLTDKALAKQFVAATLGEEWIIPTLYVGPNLPPPSRRSWDPPFVVKPTHRSGAIIFVRAQADADWPIIERACDEWTASHYGKGLEWCYSSISPRIIVERYIGGASPPNDLKFYVLDGRVHFILVNRDKHTTHSQSFFDREWNRQPFVMRDAQTPSTCCNPPHFIG